MKVAHELDPETPAREVAMRTWMHAITRILRKGWRRRCARLVVGAAALLATLPALAAEPLIRHEVQPVRLKRGAQPDLVTLVPSYPDRESVMYVFVVLDANGVPTVAYVVDGNYTQEQGYAAQRFTMLLHFDPKVVDGKPLESTALVPIRMYAPPPGPPSVPAFDASRHAVAELLEQRNWQAALDRIDQMAQNEVNSFAAYSVAQALRAAAYEGQSNLIEALKRAQSAMRLSDGSYQKKPKFFLGPKTLLIETLVRAMRVQSALGMYGDAVDTADKLEVVDKSARSGELAQRIAKVRALAAEDSPITTPMEFEIFGKTTIKIVRSEFALSDAEPGAITSLWITCRPGPEAEEAQFYEAPLNGGSWIMPGDTKNCVAEITGKAGTRFKFLQSGTAFPVD